jgi:hypothetical protein
MRIQEKRDANVLEDDGTDRIIPLDKPTVFNSIYGLKDMREKLVFGVYTFQPCGRLYSCPLLMNFIEGLYMRCSYCKTLLQDLREVGLGSIPCSV